MQIVDITQPANARIVGNYDCDILQGDIQVFTQEQRPGRTFATYTADAFGNEDSACYREAEAIGFDAIDETRSPGGRGKQGTFIADITTPSKPRTVSFVEVPQGSHNQTVHPSGDYLYNSQLGPDHVVPAQRSRCSTSARSTGRRRSPRWRCPLGPAWAPSRTTSPSTRTARRGYSAALSQGIILDTTDPAAAVGAHQLPGPRDQRLAPVRSGHHRRPRVPRLSRTSSPARPAGRCARAAASTSTRSPGDMELDPREGRATGTSTTRGPPATPTARCTAHVFDIHEERAADDGRLLRRRRSGRRPLEPRGHLARRHQPAGRGHAPGRLLPLRATRTRGPSRRRGSRPTAASTCTETTSSAASTSTASPAPRIHRSRRAR